MKRVLARLGGVFLLAALGLTASANGAGAHVVSAKPVTSLGSGANASAQIKTAAPAKPALRDNTFFLWNVTTQKCADTSSSDRGSFVHQWECQTGEQNQRWSPIDAGDGFMTLHSGHGYCMAVKDDANFNGARIIQADCNSTVAGQRWRLVNVDVIGTVNVVSALGRCLEVNRAQSNNGAQIQLWECASSSNAQGWRFS
jgi:hypothetical protein